MVVLSFPVVHLWLVFDLRKTKIRPKYVPDPENDNIERSAIFRVTGACYLWQFSIFDGDPNGTVYLDYNDGSFVPSFSHHKLTVFEYADGVNGVNINDTFQNYTLQPELIWTCIMRRLV